MAITQKHLVDSQLNQETFSSFTEPFDNDFTLNSVLPNTDLTWHRIRLHLKQNLNSVSPECWTIAASSLGCRIRFIDSQSNSVESTIIKMHWRLFQNEIWIDHLQLPYSKRGIGLGSRIVSGTFWFAHELGIASIVVMPLQSAVEFWRKNGFQPHPKKSKILQRFVHDSPLHEIPARGI